MSSDILARRLKALRDNSGFMQKFVADKIGVRSNTLSGYENGTRTPDPGIIVSLAKLYNVTTDYLFGMTDTPNAESEEFKEYINDPLTSIAFKDFENLTDEQKQEAIEMIKFIKFKESQKEQ